MLRIDAYNIKMLNTSNFQVENILLATEGRLDSSMGQRRCYNDMNPAKEVVFQAMKKIYLYLNIRWDRFQTYYIIATYSFLFVYVNQSFNAFVCAGGDMCM